MSDWIKARRPKPRIVGIVDGQQRRQELRERAKMDGVPGRMARFLLSQERGRSVPL